MLLLRLQLELKDVEAVSTSSQLIERVENAVFHEPYMIPTLFKERKVKAGFLHSRLRRYVPHRVGIEFECFGDFANLFCQNNGLKWDSWEKFEKRFNLIDFSQDTLLRRYGKGYLKYPGPPKTDNHEEVRVSIRDYRQLNGLYEILKEMAKYCTISGDCGIHIHIDLTKYNTSDQKSKAVKWFNNHLSDVESIFPKYTGTYNKRKAQQGKASWVNISCHDTVEFRIAPLTFDYEVLIPWIVKCSQLVSRMIIECYLKPEKHTKKTIEKVSSITNDHLSYTINLGDALIADGSNRAMDYWHPNHELDNILRNCRLSGSQRDLIIEGLMYSDFDREQVEVRPEGTELVLEYPDGTSARIDRDYARNVYLERGIRGVISRASTEIRTSTVGDSNLSEGSLCYNSDYVTSCVSRIATNDSATSYYTVSPFGLC